MDGPCSESDPQGAISQPNPQNLPTGPLFGERVSADVTGDPEMKSSCISQTGCHHTDTCPHERLTEEKHAGRRACGMRQRPGWRGAGGGAAVERGAAAWADPRSAVPVWPPPLRPCTSSASAALSAWLGHHLFKHKVVLLRPLSVLEKCLWSSDVTANGLQQSAS